MTTYTIADVFLPQDGSAVDGLTVEAFKVSTWGGSNNPPHLGDSPPGSPGPDATTTTSTNYGNHGAWELQLPTNEDYFVVVEYSSSYYWRRYNAPAWLDGTTSELDAATVTATNVSIGGVTAGGLDTYDGDIQTLGTTDTASESGGSLGLAAFADHIHGGLGLPLGLTGATADTRYAGGTSSGAPASGSFSVGDFVIDQSGQLWIYDSSDTWVAIAPAAAVVSAPGDLKAIAGPIVPTGWLACDGSAKSRTTYSALFAAITVEVTGTSSNGSEYITGISPNTNNLQVGWPISGPGIPSGTTISEIVSGSEVKISNNAGSGAGSGTFCGAPWGVGDGSTTFNVPNLEGAFLMGSNASYVLGATGGATTSSALIQHDHSVPGLSVPGLSYSGTTSGESGHTHGAPSSGNYLTSNSGSFDRGSTGAWSQSASTGSSTGHTHTYSGTTGTGTTGTGTTGNAGSGSSFSILPPYAAVTYIVKT